MSASLPPALTPRRMKLRKTEGLEIDWADGRECRYSLSLLRSMCPCAQCRETRAAGSQAKGRLTILPGNYSGPITVVAAEPVGNYAIRIDWSDGHGSGIYTFEYLRELCAKDETGSGGD